ncbi:hypothetical protein KEM55_001840 [Ascosphaera atra]|nr:hypothetical protein KEM55_001840 [Ascosphaera atra]
MTLETQITPHLFLKTTAPSTPEGRKCPSTIVFFVTGNPGLLSYYHSFLSLLSEGLSAASIQEDGGAAEGPYMICGTSLAGFGGEQAESKLSGKANSPKPRAYTLQEQIRFVERQLNSFIQLWRSSQGEQSGEKSAVKPNVIIIGHSVGAYIAMEILRRHREGERPDMNMNIVGEILLFPTLVDIAKSSSGVKLSVRPAMHPFHYVVITIDMMANTDLQALLYIPFLALWASLLSRLLTLALPLWMLKTLVRIVMGNPPANVVESTVDFLRSPMGVYEAM